MFRSDSVRTRRLRFSKLDSETEDARVETREDIRPTNCKTCPSCDLRNCRVATAVKRSIRRVDLEYDPISGFVDIRLNLTACPGTLDFDRLADLMEFCGASYEFLSGRKARKKKLANQIDSLSW